jgi:hypothetical protein
LTSSRPNPANSATSGRFDRSTTFPCRSEVIHSDDEQSARLVQAVEIKTRASSDLVDIEVECDRASFGNSFLGESFSLPYVDFEILVPEDAELDLSSHKSRFDINVPSGRIVLQSHKGTGTIRGVRNDLDLETHKGKFDVQVETLHDLQIQTHKGDIDVAIRNAHDFSVRGASHKGRLEFSGIDVPVRREGRSSLVSHRIGSGRQKIDLSTHKGTIHLTFE